MTISSGRVGSAEQAPWPRLPLTFATLMSALRSGNLADARQAYGDLQTTLQPHLGSLIAPVGAALGDGETAQAGRILGQMRSVIAAAVAAPAPADAGPNTGAYTGSSAAPVSVPTPAAATAAAAFDRLV